MAKINKSRRLIRYLRQKWGLIRGGGGLFKISSPRVGAYSSGGGAVRGCTVCMSIVVELNCRVCGGATA